MDWIPWILKKLMSNAVYIEQIVDLLNKTQIIVIDR